MKKARINKIIEDKVISQINNYYVDKGFTYKKSIRGFVKKDSELNYEIYVDNDYEIYLDQKFEGNYLYLVFRIFFETSIYKFEKWYYENITDVDGTQIDTFRKSLKFCLPLLEGVDFFIPDDFDKNQRTYVGEGMDFVKKNGENKYILSKFGYELEVNDFEKSYTKIFETLESQINIKYDYLQMALENENNKLMKYNALLIYDNQLEIPSKFVRNHIDRILENLKVCNDDNEKISLQKSLEKFKNIGEKYLSLKINNS